MEQELWLSSQHNKERANEWWESVGTYPQWAGSVEDWEQAWVEHNTSAEEAQ